MSINSDLQEGDPICSMMAPTLYRNIPALCSAYYTKLRDERTWIRDYFRHFPPYVTLFDHLVIQRLSHYFTSVIRKWFDFSKKEIVRIADLGNSSTFYH